MLLKKKAADWAVFSFLKAAQIWSTRPMRYSPVQADQKKPNWAATRPIWQHCSVVLHEPLTSTQCKHHMKLCLLISEEHTPICLVLNRALDYMIWRWQKSLVHYRLVSLSFKSIGITLTLSCVKTGIHYATENLNRFENTCHQTLAEFGES